MISGKKIPWGPIAVFLLPVLIFYIMFFVYPFIFLLVMGTMKWNSIAPPEFVGLGNYIYLFTNKIFQEAIGNNIVWALSTGFLQVPLATLVAVILARKPKGWKTLRTVYFLPKVISAVAVAMMWKAMYNAEYGIINGFVEMIGFQGQNWLGQLGTALPAVIAQEVLYIGYFMIIILAGTTSIPESFYEAAEIDGANGMQQTFFITLPMLRGIIITAMTVAMAYGMRHFEQTFIMTQGGPAYKTTTLGIHLYNKMDALLYGEASATGVTLILLGTVVITLMRRLLSEKEAAADVSQ